MFSFSNTKFIFYLINEFVYILNMIFCRNLIFPFSDIVCFKK